MGNLTQEEDSASGTINYGRSAAGELTSVTNATYTGQTYSPNLIGNVANGPFGPASYTLGNGLELGATYDTMGRNTGQYLCSGSTSVNCSGGQGVYGFNASYVGSQAVTTCDTVLDQCQAQGYDGFNRLVSVTDQSNNSGNPGSYSYTYDRYGNRWTQTPGTAGPSPSYSFNAANNQISGLSYDAAGNLSGDGIAHAFTYDAEGNVVQVDSGSTAQYVYDAFNRRIRTQTSSGTSEYLFDAGGERVSTWSAAGNSATEGRVYADGQQIAFLSNGSAYLEHQNWLGTERARTDYLGHLAASESSLAYGDAFSQAVYDTGSGLDNNQFAGQEYDAESGTQHAQFRQYSSTQGRWMSPDPYDGSYDFGNPQSLNRYAYALNNPLSLVDPSGLDDDGDDDGGQSGGGAGGEDDALCPDLSGLIPSDSATASTGGFLHLLGNIFNAIGNAIANFLGPGDVGGFGDTFGLSYGMSSPAGTPLFMGYQNMAKPTTQGLTARSVTVPGMAASTQPIEWRLSIPSGAGGYVIQEIIETFPDDSKPHHFWEAWRISPGTMWTALRSAAIGATHDDAFQNHPSGNIILAFARFYEGLQDIPGFQVHAINTYAGDLAATAQNPNFPIANATNPVVRIWIAP